MPESEDPVVNLLKESIITLCRANSIGLSGSIDIDGIVCISSNNSKDQIVIKVHDKFQNSEQNDPTIKIAKVKSEQERFSPISIMGRTAGNKRKRMHGIIRNLQDSSPAHVDTICEDEEEEDLKVQTNSVLAFKFDGVPQGKSTGLLSQIKQECGSQHEARYPSVTDGSPHLQGSSPTGDDDDENICEFSDVSCLSQEDVISPSKTASPSTSSKVSPKKKINYGTQKGTFPCPSCDKVFGWQRTLLRHLNTHTDTRPYVCIRCNKSFHRKDFLRYHVVTHVESDPHKCGVCHKRFSLRKSTLAHMKRFHDTTDTIACIYCFSVLPKDEIKFHMRSHDVDNIPMQFCDYCDYQTKSLYQMTEHSITHFPVYESNETAMLASASASMVLNNSDAHEDSTSYPIMAVSTEDADMENDNMGALNEDV